MSKQKRELKNFIINWPLQSRITYYFTAMCLGLVGLMMFFMNSHINNVREIIANVSGMAMTSQLEIDIALTQLLSTALGFLLLAIVGAALYGVIISHRIAGPMYAIIKYIESLKAGKFNEPRTLRPYDELRPIMEALQDLAETMQKK
ncbi:MAG: hypothetical protein KDD38_03665 [Bdellovibrionales bacterium]|nr:hypothetical protein [Bdellovibrionales bacterium]